MPKIFLIALFSIPIVYLIYFVVILARTKVPYVVTPKEYLPIILKNSNINSASIIYDLGCGQGDFLFAAEKYGPKKIVGFELSPLHAWYAQLKAKIKKSKIKIYRQDFFQADISRANIIYLFLVPKIVAEVWDKIKKEAKPGTQVVILSDKIPGVECAKVVKTRPDAEHSTKIYFYRV